MVLSRGIFLFLGIFLSFPALAEECKNASDTVVTLSYGSLCATKTGGQGDVAPYGTSDGILDISDAVVALRISLGLIAGVDASSMKKADLAPLCTQTQKDNKQCSASGDGFVDISDAVIILRLALNLVTWPDIILRSDYQYMNTLRNMAGLNSYVSNSQLEQAALNHAKYQVTNGMMGHGEIQGQTGYTGGNPGDRAKATGYQGTSTVGEVIAYEPTAVESIDGLMSAIYHRFGLMRNDVNEIGFAFFNNPSAVLQNAFVGNMANGKMAELCNGTSFSGYGTYYRMCTPEIKVEASVYNTAKNYYSLINPELVIWPTENAKGVMPVFYEESPDPLPDYSVSGYPISAEFNDTKITKVTLSSFKLYNQTNGNQVTNTRLLDKNSDPSNKFSEYQFALFPLDRLDYNTTYRAELSYNQDGTVKDKKWKFTTKDLGTIVYTIKGTGDLLPVASGNVFHVYIPPTKGDSGSAGYSTRYPANSILKAEFVDANTLKITYTGVSGDQANFTFSNGKSFSVTLI